MESAQLRLETSMSIDSPTGKIPNRKLERSPAEKTRVDYRDHAYVDIRGYV